MNVCCWKWQLLYESLEFVLNCLFLCWKFRITSAGYEKANTVNSFILKTLSHVRRHSKLHMLCTSNAHRHRHRCQCGQGRLKCVCTSHVHIMMELLRCHKTPFWWSTCNSEDHAVWSLRCSQCLEASIRPTSQKSHIQKPMQVGGILEFRIWGLFCNKEKSQEYFWELTSAGKLRVAYDF